MPRQVGKKKQWAPSSVSEEKSIRTDAGQTGFSTMLFRVSCTKSEQGPRLRQPLAQPGIIITQRGYGEIVIKISGN